MIFGNFGGVFKSQSKAKYPQNRLFLRMNLSAVNQRMQKSRIKERRIREKKFKNFGPGHFLSQMVKNWRFGVNI